MPCLSSASDLRHIPASEKRQEHIQPSQRLPLVPTENSIPLHILYEKYGDYLTESNLIKVRGLLIEPAANSYVLAERDIYLENPEIKIRVRTAPPMTSLCVTQGLCSSRVPKS